MHRATVKVSRVWTSSLFGSVAFEPHQLRACYDPQRQGFADVVHTLHSPQSLACAVHHPDGYRVLETPPLPVTPPPCGDR